MLSTSRRSSPLAVALLTLVFPRAALAIDFSNYPVASQNCLNQAASQSICNGLVALAFNACACGASANFIPLAVTCIAAGDPGDLVTVFLTAQTNCAASNTPLAYTEAQFLALAPSISSSSLSSATSFVTSTATSSTISSTTSPYSTPTPYQTPPASSGGFTATINGRPISTGAVVGIVIGLLVCVGFVSLALVLWCIHVKRRRERRVNAPVQLVNMDGGATEYGKIGQGVSTAAVVPTPNSGGPIQTAEPLKGAFGPQPVLVDPAGYRPGQQQIDPTGYPQGQQSIGPSGYQQGQQQIDPRFSMYSNATTTAPAYPFPGDTPLPTYAPGQPMYSVPAQFPSPGSTVISPVSGAGPSPRPGYVEMDSSQSIGAISPPTTTSAPAIPEHPVELSAAAQNEAVHQPSNPEPASTAIPETNATAAPTHGTEKTE